MRIKIDKADQVFSQYIRLRDKKCVRCGSTVELNEKGLPISHQNSHYFGRGKESTRFSPENCDTLCMACHIRWGGTEREKYRDFKVKQLGEERFKKLMVQSENFMRKDRKMALIVARQLLRSLFRKRTAKEFLQNLKAFDRGWGIDFLKINNIINGIKVKKLQSFPDWGELGWESKLGFYFKEDLLKDGLSILENQDPRIVFSEKGYRIAVACEAKFGVSIFEEGTTLQDIMKPVAKLAKKKWK